MDLSGKNKEIKKVSSDEVREVEDDNSLSTGFEARSVTEGVGNEHLLAELWPQVKPLIQHVVTERFFAESWPQIESYIQQVVAERLVPELLPQIEHLFRQQVRKQVNTRVPAQIHTVLHSLRQKKEIGEEVIAGSGTSKLKLCFCNQISPKIYTNNEIKALHRETLQVAIYDTSNNAIVGTGPLSSAQIEFVILNGEFDSGNQQEEPYWSLTDFNNSILSPREGKRPLIVGRDVKLYLQNGIGFILALIITDNSSWIKSKMFRLAARIIDEKILVEFPRIGEAVSEPFRVMDHRGEVNRKHHPPRMEDPVWRLEGIGKDGTYHKNLSSHNIETVGDFLRAYHENGSISLRKMLGKRVLDKTWKMMVSNALECGSVPTYDQSFEPTLMKNVAMEGEAFDNNKNLGYSPVINSREELEPMFNFEDLPPSLFSGEASTSYEMDYLNTSTQYYQGPWPKLVPKSS